MVLLVSGGMVILSYGVGLFFKVVEYVLIYLIFFLNFFVKEIYFVDYIWLLVVMCCFIVIFIVVGWFVFNKKEV